MKFPRWVEPESNIFLFLLFLSVIAGVAFGFADTYDHMSNVDVVTYTGLSDFDFNQHPVRRYRIIVPMLAAGVNFIFGFIFQKLSPNEFPGDFAQIFSFVVINCFLMSIFAVLLFRICQTVLRENYFWPSIIGVLAVLTCRWTGYIAGSALVDSLFLVTIGLLLLGVLRQNLSFILIAIYLGPWAKESFIFFVPLLFIVEQKHWLKLVIHLCISGVVIFVFRYGFDQYIGASFSESLTRDISHFGVIPESLRRLFSFHGLYEVFSIGGIWNIFLLIGLCIPQIRSTFKTHLSIIWVLLIILVLLQALLSNELARMFYLLSPMLAVFVALFFKEITMLNKSTDISI